MHLKVKRNLELNPFPDGQPVKIFRISVLVSIAKPIILTNLSSNPHDLIKLYLGKYLG